ncbi:MAG: CPBP family intramembrane metalloprotease, partial [Acidobacteriota bacterium]|nr:CPBP family intramembrane metalloprotease [Acidobacteriota bacterium]
PLQLAALVSLWCSPYLLYAFGVGDFRWGPLLKLLAVALPLMAIYSLAPIADPRLFAWQDAAIAILLIGFVLSGQLKGIWNVPANLDFMSRLFLIAVASWTWVFLRPTPGLGYTFHLSASVLKQAGLNFAYFAALAIPSSLALHFTRWNPRWHGPLAFSLDYLEIFLFIALLEELFFRGFLQNLLSNSLGNWLPAQLVVSLLFGLFHILHAPFPNWRYVGLASVAGWFYGSAFRKTQNLMASALLHAAVDTTWRTWFSAH